jgi:hypothetical protein
VWENYTKKPQKELKSFIYSTIPEEQHNILIPKFRNIFFLMAQLSPEA